MKTHLCVLSIALLYCLEVSQISCILETNNAFKTGAKEHIDLELSMRPGGSDQEMEGKLSPANGAAMERNEGRKAPLDLFPLSPDRFMCQKRVTTIENEQPHPPKRLRRPPVTLDEIAHWLVKHDKKSKPKMFLPLEISSPLPETSSRVQAVEYSDNNHPSVNGFKASQINTHSRHPFFNYVDPGAMHQNNAHLTLQLIEGSDFFHSHYPSLPLSGQGKGSSSTNRKGTENASDHKLESSEELSKYYSCQILNWNPDEIDQIAALISHYIVPEFLATTHDKIKEMHQSDSILLPFIYKMVIKHPTHIHWRYINKAWTTCWRAQTKMKSDVEILKKFTWITDLISEATLTEMYQGSQANLTKQGRISYGYNLSDTGYRLIRRLSEGRPHIVCYKHQMASVRELLGKFENESLLAPPIDYRLHEKVLGNLKKKAKQIRSSIYELEDRSPGFEAVARRKFFNKPIDTYLEKRMKKFTTIENHILEDICQRNFGQNTSPEPFSRLTCGERLAALYHLGQEPQPFSKDMLSLPKSINQYFHKFYPEKCNQGEN